MGKINKEFWKGKKVLVTGHSGFKGGWLSLWLNRKGATVTGYALKPQTNPNLFTTAKITKIINSVEGDVRNFKKLKETVKKEKIEIIFHLAAQPIVHLAYKNPLETLSTNIIGTANLLEAARQADLPKSLVCITTDKVYENKEWQWPYRENDVLGGADPYSSSKASCELVIDAYRKSFGIKAASARAGNVIGGGDWSKYRLIPDIIASIYENKPIVLRNPGSTRPWQHVLDPLNGYIMLAENLYKHPSHFASPWNFGPHGKSENVAAITEKVVKLSGVNVDWKKDRKKYPHETTFLKLDSTKAENLLGWSPRLDLQKALKFTVNWYKTFYAKGDVIKVMHDQIESFENL
jgi:CDP-glucose 4,6-dehydratase